MKKKTNHKIGAGLRSITETILDAFLGSAEAVKKSIFDRKYVYRQMYQLYDDPTWTTSAVSHALHNLKASGYLEFVKHEDGSQSVRFTNRAKIKSLEAISGAVPRHSAYLFVSFDIPEKLRQQRDLFRAGIKRLGFVQIQKSLWACDKDLSELVELLTKEYEIADYVVYLLSSETNINKYISNCLEKPSQSDL